MSKKFKVPQMLGGTECLSDVFDDFTETHEAAHEHSKQLTEAEDELMVAWDMALVLRGFLNETRIAECMQAATLVQQIEERVVNARHRIDQHATKHHNLFLAYFLGGAK